MKGFTRTALSCSLALALANSPVAAIAEKGQYYVFGGAGANLPLETEAKNGTFSDDIDYDVNPAGIAGLGYYYNDVMRTEVELGYRTNKVDEIAGSSAGIAGDATTYSAMVNVVFDFKNNTAITPYIGGGLGIAHVDLDGVNPVNTSLTLDDTTTIPAGQAIAGLSYSLNKNWDIFADYRFFSDIGGNDDYALSNGSTAEADYSAHSGFLGVRYLWGGEEKAKPAAAPRKRKVTQAPKKTAPKRNFQPEARSRSYLVFFNFDSSKLTQQTKDIVSQVVSDAKKGDIIGFEVTGHADRAGAKDYNQGLSLSRATAVKDELIKLGIPSKEISMKAKGESQPLVATGDGIKEPQNRRVEIYYTIEE